MTTQRTEREEKRGNAEVKFLAGWRDRWPNLYGVCLGQAQYKMVRLSLSERATGDFLGVLVAADPVDGSPMVVFGSGADLLTALSNLNSSIASSRWRPNKPYGS